jgi:hypothetical protein
LNHKEHKDLPNSSLFLVLFVFFVVQGITTNGWHRGCFFLLATAIRLRAREEAAMKLRWIVLVAIWTILSGPIFAPRTQNHRVGTASERPSVGKRIRSTQRDR